MGWGLVSAFGSAVCYGVASVIQALAARDEPSGGGGIDPRSLLRLVSRWRFLAGLGLDLAGFAAQLAAVRVLPLFVVQAAVAASLAVTAVTARWVLGSELGRWGWAGVALVTAGLAGLAGTVGPGSDTAPARGLHLGVLGCAVGLILIGVAAGRTPPRVRAPALGLVAGLGFGVVAIASRLVTDLAPAHLLTEPAAYAVVLGGVVAFGFYAAALQAGSVTVVTTLMVVGETVGPAAVGVALLGDQTRGGLAWVAVLGFAVVLLGAGTLARFGEVHAAPPTPRPAG